MKINRNKSRFFWTSIKPLLLLIIVMHTTTQNKVINKVTVKVTVNTGDTWLSTFNGTIQDAIRYFFGHRFVLRENEATGHETFGTVVSVEQIN